MLHRLTFLGITLFWVTMNYLLWRAEFGRKGETPSRVPPDKVWEKVLMSPDASSMEIFHHKKKMGSCRWVSHVGEDAANETFAEDYTPEGMVAEPTSYTLELEGNVMVPSLTNTVRFDLLLKLSTNQTWQEFRLRFSLRPTSWEISSKAADETVQFIVSDPSGGFEETYKFADLQNPQNLVRQFGGPWAVALAGSLGLPPNSTNQHKLSLGLDWIAYNDMMQFGQSKVRVHRLETKLLGRFRIYIFVSRIGEILWVHLPDEWVLSNDTFEHF